MKNYRQLLKELPSKTIVLVFGRFNPPTVGHELLIKVVKKVAKKPAKKVVKKAVKKVVKKVVKKAVKKVAKKKK